MKQNTYYILTGIIGLILLILFGVSVFLRNPFIITVGFVIGACLYFYFGKQVTDSSSDERQKMIDMKTASATLKAFWISFFAMNLATVVYVFSAPLGIQKFTISRSVRPDGFTHTFDLLNTTLNGTDANTVLITLHNNTVSKAEITAHAVQLLPQPPEMIAISHLGIFGAAQILLLILMLFIYVGFRMYYAHQLGEWDSDEE
jgi:uncharacterized membrane protein